MSRHPHPFRAEWAPSIPRELMAGAVATFALIPEVIAFSFVAGVDPAVGLYASFAISLIIAFAGGRPAMVSAAAGSVALVAAPLVHQHGVQYLFAAGILAGAVQILFGWLRLGVLMRFVSGSVRTGFVNALAILIFSAQMPHLVGANGATWAMVGAGLVIIYGLPRLTTLVPSPLVCIVVLTLVAQALHLPLKTVADLGLLPDGLPSFGMPQVPMAFETLKLIALPAVAIAMVGLLESMMTASVVDELTDTPSSKNRECGGLGLANIVASLFGGIAGCGMIGQTVSNVRYGGRGRLSTLFAGAFLLVLMVLLKPWVSQVPVAALVAIMVMVSASTFDWGSARALLKHPKLSSVVMVATVVVTVLTDNLAAGVSAGVLLSGVFFTFKVSRLFSVTKSGEELLTYRVSGQIFFASADMLVDAFDVRDIEAKPVLIDLSAAHFWDITAVNALDKVCQRLRKHGSTVDLVGMNEHSRAQLSKLDLGIE
ncbi:SulP family inorganic anion transporter [Paucibacter sp. R3-3]|uniref:SulP family inorganic anion transporter n=1 Tax=Roseateles agri TaxID=3098619 RepID=A0ABU5DK83_9BURK|nr:SulP family inorganic anion transporter [Paucibacter sp. R3-3]MDY0746707.1 SulP family inorganic anion transporter [Paucibacter sp. R3-3]